MYSLKSAWTGLFMMGTASILSVTTVHATVVLDMEGIAPSGGIASEPTGSSRVLNGFIFSPVQGDFVDSEAPTVGNRLADNGTDWFFHTRGSAAITLTKVDGGVFSIRSFDATFYNTLFNGDASLDHNIQAIGILSSGGLVSTIFTIDDLPSFETFTFGSEWTSLTSISFKVPDGDGRMGYDNIVLDEALSPVPLPAALPLFLAALSGLGFFGWRNRRKAAVAA